MRKLGADEFIDYKKAKFEEKVSGVDVVFDTVGGETQERDQSLDREREIEGARGDSAAARGSEESASALGGRTRGREDYFAALNRMPRAGMRQFEKEFPVKNLFDSRAAAAQ